MALFDNFEIVPPRYVDPYTFAENNDYKNQPEAIRKQIAATATKDAIEESERLAGPVPDAHPNSNEMRAYNNRKARIDAARDKAIAEAFPKIAAQTTAEKVYDAGNSFLSGVNSLGKNVASQVFGYDSSQKKYFDENLKRNNDSLSPEYQRQRQFDKQKRDAEIQAIDAENKGGAFNDYVAEVKKFTVGAKRFGDDPINTLASGAGSLTAAVPAVAGAYLGGLPALIGTGTSLALGAVGGFGESTSSRADAFRERALKANMSKDAAEKIALEASKITEKTVLGDTLSAGFGMVDTLTGAAGAVRKLATKQVAGQVAKNTADGIGKATVKTSVAEGGGETGQGLSADINTNKALNDYGFKTDLLDGVLDKAGTNFVSGVAMGAPLGAAAQYRQNNAPTAPDLTKFDTEAFNASMKDATIAKAPRQQIANKVYEAIASGKTLDPNTQAGKIQANYLAAVKAKGTQNDGTGTGGGTLDGTAESLQATEYDGADGSPTVLSDLLNQADAIERGDTADPASSTAGIFEAAAARVDGRTVNAADGGATDTAQESLTATGGTSETTATGEQRQRNIGATTNTDATAAGGSTQGTWNVSLEEVAKYIPNETQAAANVRIKQAVDAGFTIDEVAQAQAESYKATQNPDADTVKFAAQTKAAYIGNDFIRPTAPQIQAIIENGKPAFTESESQMLAGNRMGLSEPIWDKAVTELRKKYESITGKPALTGANNGTSKEALAVPVTEPRVSQTANAVGALDGNERQVNAAPPIADNATVPTSVSPALPSGVSVPDTNVQPNAGSGAVVQTGAATVQPAKKANLVPIPATSPEIRVEQKRQQEIKRRRVANLTGYTYAKSPFLAFLGSHGINISLKREFSPDKNPMLSGYGPMFRRNGLSLDALTEQAVQDGFLPPDTNDDTAIYELINRQIRGESITALYTEDGATDAMQAEIDRRAQFKEDVAFEELSQVTYTTAELDALEDIPWDTPADSSIKETTRQAMEAMGFSEQEIQDEIAREQRIAQEASQSSNSASQAEASQPREGATATAEQSGEGLTSPTRADVLAQQQQRDAESQRREQGGDAPLPARKVTADTPDMFNTQGSVFDQPQQSQSPSITNPSNEIDEINAALKPNALISYVKNIYQNSDGIDKNQADKITAKSVDAIKKSDKFITEKMLFKAPIDPSRELKNADSLIAEGLLVEGVGSQIATRFQTHRFNDAGVTLIKRIRELNKKLADVKLQSKNTQLSQTAPTRNPSNPTAIRTAIEGIFSGMKDAWARISKHTVVLAETDLPALLKAKPYLKAVQNSITAYHGSPYRFNEFSLEHLGRGEGAQAYGWGLYFADSKDVAEYYRKALVNNTLLNEVNAKLSVLVKTMDADAAIGYRKFKSDVGRNAAKEYDDLINNRNDLIKENNQTYRVNIKPDEDTFLLWDKPLSEQPQKVKDALEKSGLLIYSEEYFKNNYISKPTGANLHDFLKYSGYAQSTISNKLFDAGISGTKYLNGDSRIDGKGGYNYVVFDDKAVEIVEAYYSRGDDAKVQAFYDPTDKDKKIYLIADRITKGQEASVWLHEVFHKRGEELLGKENLKKLYDNVQGWKTRKPDSVERQIYEAAHKRATDSGDYEGEFLTYAIEEASNRGVTPDASKGTISAAGWLAKVKTLYTNALRKLLRGDAGKIDISANDLMAMAYGAAGLEYEGKTAGAQGDGVVATSNSPVTSKMDADYMAAVKRGDTAEVQRMVDEQIAKLGAMWHGTPSGDLRGGTTGLHIGTKQAAIEALEARIGIPADGKGWDGTREYGKTLLAGKERIESGKFGKYRLSGYNVYAPSSDYYPSKMPTVGNGVAVDSTWKPWLRPVMIVGEMTNTRRTPISDNAANRKIKRVRGAFYTNEGEDVGSVSAVMPSGESVRVKLADPITYDDNGNVIPLSERFNPKSEDIRYSLTPFDGIEKAVTPLGDTKTITVNGKEYSAFNSDGKPIHGTVEGVRNFVRWFADSKVTDNGKTMAQGAKPLVMYHGTKSDVKEFSRSSIGSATDEGFLGDGFYFTDEPRAASGYAKGDGGNIVPAYVSIKNPYYADGLLPDYMNAESLQASGYDGVIYKTDGTNDYSEYVAFNPNQVKSSTGNTGDFNPTNPDIRFSRVSSIDETLEIIKTGKLPDDKRSYSEIKDLLVTKFTDSTRQHDVWTRDLPDQGDAATLIQAKNLASGRESAFNKEVMDNFGSRVSAAAGAIHKANKDISTEAALRLGGDWMSARFAIIANQNLLKKDTKALQDAVDAAKLDASAANKAAVTRAKNTVLKRQAAITDKRVIDPSKQKLDIGLAGGYNDATAKQMMMYIEERIDVSLLEDLANVVYEMNDWKLQKDIELGKVTKEMAAQFDQSGKYVPLTGDPRADETAADVFGTGSTNQGKDRAMQGRTSGIAQNGIDASFEQVQKTARYHGWADYKDALHGMYEKSIAKYLADGSTQQEAQKKTTEDLGISRSPETVQRPSDDVIIYRKNGKSWVYDIGNKAAIDALRSANVEPIPTAYRYVALATRAMARLVTQFMPGFAPVNALRDTWEKSENIRTRIAPNYPDMDMNKVARTMLNQSLKSLTTLHKSIMPVVAQGTPVEAIAKLDPNNADQKLMMQFLSDGGASTWGQFLSTDGKDLAEKLGKMHKLPTKAVDTLDVWNNSWELISSFSVYKALRENGMDSKAASNMALELMNFRKGGELMKPIKALYMFAQPIATGGHQLLQTLDTRRGKARFAAYATIAFLLYSLLRSGEDDDELGINRMDNRPNYEIERSIIIPYGDAGKSIAIPIGFGLPMLAWTYATNIAKMTLGKQTASETAIELLVKTPVKTFAPVAPSESSISKNPFAWMVQTIAPTIGKPIANVALDRTAFGGSLTSSRFEKPDKANALEGRLNTPEFYKDAAKELANVGLDTYPEVVREIIHGYFIGALNVVVKAAIDNPAKEARGKEQVSQFIDRWVKNQDRDDLKQRLYYRYREELNDVGVKASLGKTLDDKQTAMLKILEETKKDETSVRTSKAQAAKKFGNGKNPSIYEAELKRVETKQSDIQVKLIRKMNELDAK